MLSGNVIYAGCQWAMLMVLARCGTPELVGQFVLALAVTCPVMAFFMMQLRMVQATDAQREYHFGDYFALRLATTGLAVAAIVAIAAASGYRIELVGVIVAAAISAAIDSVSDIVYGLLQQRERMDRVAKSLIIKGVLSLVGLSAAILVTKRLVYGILAIAACRLAVLVFFDLRNAAAMLRNGSNAAAVDGRGRLRPRWHVATMITLGRLSFPLGLVMMLVLLCSSTPRYFVERYLGEHALGIFGALGYLGEVGATAILAIGHAAVPRLAQWYALGRMQSFCVLVLALAAMGAAVGGVAVVVAMVAGQEILAILYGPEYAENSAILVWMMIAAGIGYVASLNGYGITAARRFRIQIPLLALVAATAAASCYWLVPGGGLRGAALALCMAGLAQVAGQGCVILHAVRSRGREARAWHRTEVSPEGAPLTASR